MEEASACKKVLTHFQSKNVTIVPFHVHPKLNEIAREMKMRVYSDNIFELPDKRWIHPTIPSSKETSDIFGVTFPEGVPVPRGYACYSKEELIAARNLLERDNVTRMLIKPVFESLGRGIYFFQTDEEFSDVLDKIMFAETPERNFPCAFIIEEFIENELFEGKCLTPIVHYIGSDMCPGVFQQNVSGFRYSGMNSMKMSEKIEKQCKKYGDIIAKALNLTAFWGMDFIVDENENCFVVDLNIGRMCGSHYYRIFVDLYTKFKHFDSYTIGNYNMKLAVIQDKINQNNIAFDYKTGKGVTLIKAIDDPASTILIVGETDEEVKQFREIFQERVLELKKSYLCLCI